MRPASTGPALALTAALLFGLSAPAAKVLLGLADAWLLAGLLYLGSGLGLGAYAFVARLLGSRRSEASIGWRDMPWLIGAIVSGGVAGPVLMLLGLAGSSVTQTALLLNLEGVFTALLAWFAFREAFATRVAIGMSAIALGAMVLAWDVSRGFTLDWSAVLVIAACVAWAIDNNLTRRVAASDPVQIATLKGAAAGAVNLVIALGSGATWPRVDVVVLAGTVGLLGYGTSLVLFVFALRALGTARTGAYFSTAPFIGAVAGVAAFGEAVTARLLAAALLMAVGVWLHLTERHEHEHLHEPLAHDHLHWHDAHHEHEHPGSEFVSEPHAHRHAHGGVRHSHPHYPDLHHRHQH